MARKIARAATVDGVGAYHHDLVCASGGKMKRTPHPDAKPVGAFSLRGLPNRFEPDWR
jgi:hypothetical protein